MELVARPVIKVAFVKVTALSVPYVTCAVPALPRIMSAIKWPDKYFKKSLGTTQIQFTKLYTFLWNWIPPLVSVRLQLNSCVLPKAVFKKISPQVVSPMSHIF